MAEPPPRLPGLDPQEDYMRLNTFPAQIPSPRVLAACVLTLALVLSLAAAGPAVAQENEVEPPISGTVTDAAGG